ncbi:MAG UNVERIFIED_CONTAM: hypothetical protein LVT10_20005 [Anaerolineae bacterium]
MGVPQQLAHSATRNWASNFVKRMMVRVLNIPFARQIYPYRAFYAYLRQAFEHYDSPYVNIDALLSWGAIALPKWRSFITRARRDDRVYFRQAAQLCRQPHHRL